MNNYGKIFEYKGNILAQLIWIIIFLVLSGLTVVIIQQSISAYLNYSVTSTFETIYKSPTDFQQLRYVEAIHFQDFDVVRIN